MKCNHCGLEHQDWLEHTSYEHLGVKACLVSLKRSEVVKAEGDVVHCRATSSVGPALGASAAWEVGVPVSFMFMPAGTHTITAGFRKGSIELTVQCDESTAKAVQASLDAWRAERPKQQPFGCIEHREHEASVCVSASCGFEWKEDGVYLAAEPTSLGANNVNGKVHRSWSPSFTTDADYAKATEDGGTLRFPEGVRGSRSNPAQITGVDFCVGTLTNRPAFIEMKPVKAREADAVTAAGTSEGAKKGWDGRGRFPAKAKSTFEPRIRFNWGYHDAAQGEQNNWHTDENYWGFAKEFGQHIHSPEDVLEKHFDPHYAQGWYHGVQDSKSGKYKGNSDEAWKRHQSLKAEASDATASAAVRASGPFNTVLAREADADAILDKIVARNKPKPVTVDQINAKFGQTKTGDTRKTPDEILAGIYARAGIKATWSDAAREASAEARRGHTKTGDPIHEGMAVKVSDRYGGKVGTVKSWDRDKSFIVVKHSDGSSASYHHSDLHTHHEDED